MPDAPDDNASNSNSQNVLRSGEAGSNSKLRVILGRVRVLTNQFRHGRWFWDTVIVVAIFLLGGGVGALQAAGYGQGSFYQYEYGPAVSVACGHRFAESAGPSIQEQRFLAHTKLDGQTFDCKDLKLPDTAPADLFAQQTRYLMLAVAYMWRIFGISWAAVIPLFALFFGVTTVLFYGLFRLVVGRTLSTISALIILFSPVQLAMLTNFRDYSKAPFLLSGILLTWLTIRYRHSLKSSLICSGAAGLITGVGLGFRPDALYIAPFFLLAVIIFSVQRPSRTYLIRTAACLFVFIAGLLLLAFPVLHGHSGENNDFLDISQGLTQPFTNSLNLADNLYDFGYIYNDSYSLALMNAQATLVDGHNGFFNNGSSAMAKYSRQYYLAVAASTPADIVARAEAATVKSIDITPTSIDTGDQEHVAQSPLRAVADMVARFDPAYYWPGSGLIVVLLALALIAIAYSKRAALFALAALLFFGGISGAQYDIRHAFQLQFVHVFAYAILLRVVLRLVATALQKTRGRPRLRLALTSALVSTRAQGVKALLPIAIVGIVASVATLGLLIGTRQVQVHTMSALLSNYTHAQRRHLHLTTVPGSLPDSTLMQPTTASSEEWSGSTPLQSALFVATFGDKACPSQSIEATFRYKAPVPYLDFTFQRQVGFPHGVSDVDVYFVGFREGHLGGLVPNGVSYGGFAGVELPNADLQCFKGLSVLRGTAHKIPVVMDAQLPSNWKTLTLYQTFAAYESRVDVTTGVPTVTAGPGATALSRSLKAGDRLVSWSRLVYEAPGLHLIGQGWNLAGSHQSSYGYLAESRSIALKKGQQILVHGSVSSGAITVGLLHTDAWAGQANVTTTGEFYATIAAPSTGSFNLVIAADLPGPGPINVTVQQAFLVATR